MDGELIFWAALLAVLVQGALGWRWCFLLAGVIWWAAGRARWLALAVLAMF